MTIPHIDGIIQTILMILIIGLFVFRKNRNKPVFKIIGEEEKDNADGTYSKAIEIEVKADIVPGRLLVTLIACDIVKVVNVDGAQNYSVGELTKTPIGRDKLSITIPHPNGKYTIVVKMKAKGDIKLEHNF